MTTVEPAGDVGHPVSGPAATRPAGPGRPVLLRVIAHPATAALLTWLLLSPVAALVPVWTGADPFRQQDADMPLALGGVLLAAGVLLSWRLRSATAAGIAAGLFAAFTVLLMRTALHGTPFGFEGLVSDTGRLSAMATRYTTTWASSDGVVAGVPSEYPPLFPYLIGKTAALLDLPAWRLIAPAEIITMSGAVVASFALWQRLVSAPAALAISVLVIAARPAPNKSYEVLALAVMVPWLLMTVGRPERGRLGWLPAGLIGALLFQVFFGYLLYAAPGVLVLAWAVWRGAPDRRAYLLHLAKAAAVVVVLALWFLVPYAAGMLRGGKQVADMWDAPQSSENPFPFLAPTVLGAIQLGGLGLLLWYRRTAWWAAPLLTLLLGTYAYRLLNMLRWVFGGHTGLYYYTTPLISACLLAAAVLGTLQALPWLAARLPRPAPPATGAGVLAVITALAGFGCWSAWMPANRWVPKDDNRALPARETANRITGLAHVQQMPGMGDDRPRYAKEAEKLGFHSRMVPAYRIQDAVDRLRGPGYRPVTVSFDEQPYAVLPWRGYIAAMRTASAATGRFDERLAELRRIARFTDPEAFAEESARTRFGGIDMFVLKHDGTDVVFRPLQVRTPVRFSPGQFDSAHWMVIDGLRHGAFVAIRR
ncbi:arabinofuranosyltransferase [Actinomadura montaniterrae]|uniref:Arabinofuranosyltransferase AftA N-terminal domain-containing protein n=1 Tax=Actinomadura montaniterrae TaxID=1803903 RepID=A0A6L3VJ08_9ACTN|nr:arabinofuranosyltransferase [Actinomadura montaniterrae]KAB2370837.1 hypothetical protein F9B16_33965 [Actinomadura montaniterrae]